MNIIFLTTKDTKNTKKMQFILPQMNTNYTNFHELTQINTNELKS